MLTDPIADLLTRIKNASRARKYQLDVPYSKIKLDILAILKKRRFIEEFSAQDEKEISITLLPEKREIEVKRISKPGQRIYIKSTEIKKINGGMGLSIISTPKGVMTGEEAFKAKLGGELLCEIY